MTIPVLKMLLFTFLGISALANADALISSVSCTTGGQTVLSTSACSGPSNSGSGTASATYSISGNTLTVDVASFAESTPGPTETSVGSNASVNLNVYSTNYVGQAYVVLSGAGADAGGNTYGEPQYVLLQMTPGYSTLWKFR
jgi:hypothetical protein